MADQPTAPATGDTPPTPTPPVAPETPAAPEPPTTAELGESGVETLRKEREARKVFEKRVKELEPLAARLAKIEEGEKTETQKLAEKLDKAEKAAADARAEALRFRIASKHQISDEDAETFLTGSDEETLTRQAERLAALAAQTAPPGNGRVPVEQLRPGALPNPPEPTLADQIATAEKAGDWTTARRLKSQQLMELQQKTT